MVFEVASEGSADLFRTKLLTFLGYHELYFEFSEE